MCIGGGGVHEASSHALNSKANVQGIHIEGFFFFLI